MAAGRYGRQPMNQSAELLERPLRRVQELTAALDGQRLWVRGRLHTSRAKGGCWRRPEVPRARPEGISCGGREWSQDEVG